MSEMRTSDNVEAFLFWSDRVQGPPETLINKLLDQKIDVWHAGLKLGMQGLPAAIDYVAPTWMLNCDPAPNIEATSWRLSLDACLVRTEVIRKMGWLRPGFKTLEAAMLEMGHRWISNGVMMRHVPEFLGDRSKVEGRRSKLPFEDELRFIYYRFGKKWAIWALSRAVMTRRIAIIEGMDAFDRVTKDLKPEEPGPYRPSAQRTAHIVQKEPFRHCEPPQGGDAAISVEKNQITSPLARNDDACVSVLIPTLNRYPYLEKVLEGLRTQTIKPLEVIIVDQSRKENRNPEFYKNFSDLPLKTMYQDEPGQCSSRNAGLQKAEGKYVLFLDDDDEIEPDLIGKHLRNFELYQCEVSSGVADEVGAGPLPRNFTFVRQSDVFPTNNTMIKRDILKKSGLFDLAYNRKQRADGDLGMRIYLSGAHMILDPSISVLHHHAPEGGLRQHKARVTTYAKSRHSLFAQQLPSDSEIYLGLRYFSNEQVAEFLWHKSFGTLFVHANQIKKMLKAVLGFLLLPHTLYEIIKRYQSAKTMLNQFPQIGSIE